MTNNKPNREELRELLKQECELRNSSIIQDMYDARADYGDQYDDSNNKVRSVEDFVQNIIISRSGFNIYIDEYRSMLQENREEFKNDAFFIKHNIMVKCPIKVGSILDINSPKWNLYDFNLTKIKFANLLDNSRTNIMLVSSST